MNRLTEKFFHRLNHGRELGGDLFVIFRFQLSQNRVEFDFFFRRKRALAGDALRVNDDAFNAALNFQRVVFNVFADAAENSVEQLFFRRQFRFGLGRYLADENVALADVRSNADNAVFVQIAKSLFRNVGNVSGEFLASQFGVANFFFQFDNMDAGVRIVLNEFFRQNDSVFVVVTFPDHKRAQDVASQSQFAVINGGAVGDDVASRENLTRFDDRTLVLAGQVVQTDELSHDVFVFVLFGFNNLAFAVYRTGNNAANSVNVGNFTSAS